LSFGLPPVPPSSGTHTHVILTDIYSISFPPVREDPAQSCWREIAQELTAWNRQQGRMLLLEPPWDAAYQEKGRGRHNEQKDR
jgi:hypothetical protein